MISSADIKQSLKGDDFAPTGITEATIAKNKAEKEKKKETRSTSRRMTQRRQRSSTNLRQPLQLIASPLRASLPLKALK